MYYFYVGILTFISVLLLNCFITGFTVPKKIKILTFSAVSFMILRYISIIIMFCINNIKHLYIFRSLVFTNIISVTIIAIICFYIFLRKSKINPIYFLAVIISIVIVYCLVILKCNINIFALKDYGYVVSIKDCSILLWIYIILNTLTMISAVMVIDKAGINKFGIILVLISSIITIVENVAIYLNCSVFPHNIIGDAMWIVTLLYGLLKIRK